MRASIIFFLFWVVLVSNLPGQHTIPRQWNEAVLEAIRNDFARPTVHARNLFHTSIAMYDIWATYNGEASTYLLGRTVHGFKSDFDGIATPDDVGSAQEEAMSYAVYRLIRHRFVNSPGVEDTYALIDELFNELGYDATLVSTDYQDGSAATFGNFVAETLISYGQEDGSNEQEDYNNQFYFSINPSLEPDKPGNSAIVDANRWQSLALETFIDQAGNPVSTAIAALSPEWGLVAPFALDENNLTVFERDGGQYWLYNDPGPPPYLSSDGSGTSEDYQWGFSLVSIWSSHLDPDDGVMWDISPGAIGDIPLFQEPISSFPSFYNLLEGGDPSQGREINPYTGAPYVPQVVPRGDYARVLAEFWADGPDSETPPGHWFTILNTVNDSEFLEKKFMGDGAVLDDLEWDVKSYLALGGAMHDAAISAWGLKGWYDYIRPVSAIRYMGGKGQSTDPNDLSYSPEGLPLTDGLIEIVRTGDALAGDNNENIGKIKLYTWKGPDFIQNAETDKAGVGWILSDNWWPYQRPTFVTPPFPGYVSGHSTYSRAAAEVLTMITGDEYFPGGIGEFKAPKNEFLVFEEGPSVDITLQWATYRDASDQTSLSRIWGGIHPPADDIPGRIIGEQIGKDAFDKAAILFQGEVLTNVKRTSLDEYLNVYPNPVLSRELVSFRLNKNIKDLQVDLVSLEGKYLATWSHSNLEDGRNLNLTLPELETGIYIFRFQLDGLNAIRRIRVE